MEDSELQQTIAGQRKNSQIDDIQHPRTTWQRLNKNVLCLILFLNIVGIVLLIVGGFLYGEGVQGVIAMFVLGGICLLPGIYALHHIIKAFRAKTVDERDRALEDVPE
ncbi:unnamed protein product [Paramecium sonneborni]|uniref:Uncharacterized protein n=1 Tax=Paramecium sonneborni TaxID=65129 RepID=A0A8S1MRU7_9CILI|nr:unnamed protein product [Paramecium sonneborni]